MRVLIVSDSKSDRELMGRYLAERAHVVDLCTSAEAAGRLEHGLSDVAVMDWSTCRPSGAEFIRSLRSAEGPRHVYTIVVMGNPVASSVSLAFEAGADDLLRRPFLGEELVQRVGAIERIRRWAAKILVQTEDPTVKTARLRVGAIGERAIRQDFAAFFQREFELRDAPPAERRCFGVEIPLTLVEERTQCRLQIGIDAASLQDAATILLGSDNPTAEAAADMLRELANVAGGAFVGAAESDGFSVTLGLPTSSALECAWGRAAGTVKEFGLGIIGSPFELSIRVVAESHELRSLPPQQLTAGMVLAQDACNGKGTVLLPATTRLTETSIARLKDLLPERCSLVVLAQ